jgi:hypothetical protein
VTDHQHRLARLTRPDGRRHGLYMGRGVAAGPDDDGFQGEGASERGGRQPRPLVLGRHDGIDARVGQRRRERPGARLARRRQPGVVGWRRGPLGMTDQQDEGGVGDRGRGQRQHAQHQTSDTGER